MGLEHWFGTLYGLLDAFFGGWLCLIDTGANFSFMDYDDG